MTLITYHIEADHQGKLRGYAKLACAFWNKFILPKSSIVIRIDTFTNELGSIIASSDEVYQRDGVIYGPVQINTKYIENHSDTEVIGTIIHEIGHVLGIGRDKWMKLFKKGNGRFKKKFIKKIPALKDMYVETDLGPGSMLAHWDEQNHKREIMSGVQNESEFVHPVTIEVMELLGHKVVDTLSDKCQLKDIIDDLKSVEFAGVEDMVAINRETFINTNIWEEIYSYSRTPFV